MARPRIVVVGGGFAGVRSMRRLERRIPPHAADLVMISPFNYMLYRPLLPQVAAGVLTPQSIAVPLRRLLRRAHVIPGGVLGVDPAAKVCEVQTITGATIHQPYDRLILAPGSVTRTFDIPGLTEHAKGMKNLAEAVFMRDHVIAQMEVANATDDVEERRARLRFVVVGAGYTGVETAASLHLLTTTIARRFARLDPRDIHWHLIDLADRVLPELGEQLGRTTVDFLRSRGIEVSLGTSVAEARETSVRLTDGRELPTHTLVWAAGVTPSPVVSTLGAETTRGRLVTGADLAVHGHPDVFALGDAAAVPDLSRGGGTPCPPTAQHAYRQGPLAADNAIASLAGTPHAQYRHRDLGLVVDLGGPHAVARPLGVDLTGLPAQLVTRGYHLLTVPSAANKARVAANWALHVLAGDDFARLGFLASRTGTIQDFETSSVYLTGELRDRTAIASTG